MRRFVGFAAALGFLWETSAFASGAPMPEFGKSVSFDRSVPDLTMTKLRGKGVLVMFFQSWCPICNGWSPRLLKQVEEAHADNHSVILIAIKTDGGGAAGAKQYIKSQGGDPDKWFIGADDNAAFHKQVTGKDELWDYVLVNAQGNIVEHGNAGSFYSNGPQQGKFVLAGKDLAKACGKLTTLLPADKKYPGNLARVARLAEIGCLAEALQLCGKTSGKDKESAKGLHEEILAAAEKKINDAAKTLGDEKLDWGSKYEAYKSLSGMVQELKMVPAAKTAQAEMAKVAANPAFQKEKAAENAYNAIAAKVKKASSRDSARLATEMRAAGEKFAGTMYGQLAAEEAARLAAAKKND